MKVLTTSIEISRQLTRLINECSACQVAVAWASIGFEAFKRLSVNRAKISRMIVGTHFYQTNPEFIKDFSNNANVRFIMRTDGVFHPKTYLFWKGLEEWECLIGSPNFTQGGLHTNDEMAVLITHCDIGAQQALADVTARLDAYWSKAAPISDDQLNNYREAWRRKQPVVKSLRGIFGDPNREEADDRGKNPLQVKILQLGWDQYFQIVKTERSHQPNLKSFEGRLKVLRATREILRQKEKFHQLGTIDRQKIAGLIMAEGIDFLWFGSMRGSGYFKKAIKDNNEHLSSALDLIPAAGIISRDTYLAYILHQ